MLDLLQQFADWIWAGIEWLTGWAPGEKIKYVLEFIGAVLGVIGGAVTMYALARGGGAATKKDVGEVKSEVSDVSAEVAALRAQMAQMQSALGGDGLGADLDAGIDTLLKAGRADALRDKSGEAAQDAIEELIAERARARERIAADEAALYRQKGAFAFLHDTHAAMAAYAKATELDPDDPDGWNRLGALQLRTGALDAAINSFERVLGLSNKLSDKTWEAKATGNLGLIYRRRGELDRAEAMHLKSLEIEKELGRKEGVAKQSGNLGLIYRTRGELDRAEAMFKRDLELSEELGSKEGQARATGNLGLIYETRGELDRAEAMSHKCIELAKEIGKKETQAIEYGNLGSLYQQQGDTARACKHWARARDLFREIGMAPQVEQVEGWMRDAGCPEG
jgi:tetratricopeptide (TPR) repeat protein